MLQPKISLKSDPKSSGNIVSANGSVCAGFWPLLGGLSDQPERESYDAIGLIDRDWWDEISFHPRRARPGHLDRLRAGRLTDEQASALAETLEGRKREVRGIAQ